LMHMKVIEWHFLGGVFLSLEICIRKRGEVYLGNAVKNIFSPQKHPMFSIKMLWWILISLIISLLLEKLIHIPPYLYRPLLIVALILFVGIFYLRYEWYFSEEKLVEKVAEHRKEPSFHHEEKSKKTKRRASLQKPLF
jgi:hypothetical protein